MNLARLKTVPVLHTEENLKKAVEECSSSFVIAMLVTSSPLWKEEKYVEEVVGEETWKLIQLIKSKQPS